MINDRWAQNKWGKAADQIRAIPPPLRSFGGQARGFAVSGVFPGVVTQGGALPESRFALGYKYCTAYGVSRMRLRPQGGQFQRRYK
ncbi:MAG TPA: hypothetical protein VME24_11520 [Alphaproteobacteria bacterium]|nr:hypothetical protein [Alphaproteobacteria bacterium]